MLSLPGDEPLEFSYKFKHFWMFGSIAFSPSEFSRRKIEVRKRNNHGFFVKYLLSSLGNMNLFDNFVLQKRQFGSCCDSSPQQAKTYVQLAVVSKVTFFVFLSLVAYCHFQLCILQLGFNRYRLHFFFRIWRLYHK